MAVFDFSAAPYSADPSGVALATRAIQAALDDAGASAGNLVTAAPGRYSLDAGLGIQAPFPITWDTVSRDAVYLVARAPFTNVLSIQGANHRGSDHNTVLNVSLDTSINTAVSAAEPNGVRSSHAKCLLIGGSFQTVENIRAIGGNADFCVMANGPGWSGGAPGAGTLEYNLGNALRHALITDHVHDDGVSWSFQGGGFVIEDVQQNGSRLALYMDGQGTVDGYQFTPGRQKGATQGLYITTPSTDVTVRGFHLGKGSHPILGAGGLYAGSTVDPTRISWRITLDGLTMYSTDTLAIGDVDQLLIENASLGNVKINPHIVARGLVTATHHGPVSKHPQRLPGGPPPVIAISGW